MISSLMNLSLIEKKLRYPVKINDVTTNFMDLEDRIKYHQVPGVSIAVSDQEKILWAKGYGVKDISTKEVVNEDTIFQACSISKMVTAFGVLLLVQEKILDLDKDISIYLRDI